MCGGSSHLFETLLTRPELYKLVCSLQRAGIVRFRADDHLGGTSEEEHDYLPYGSQRPSIPRVLPYVGG